MRTTVRTLARMWVTGIGALISASYSLSAQNPCDPASTFGVCVASYQTRPPAPNQARDAEKAKAKATVEKRSTGGDGPGVGAGTTIANYLPRLAAAVAAPGLSGDTAALGLSLNVPLNDGVLFNTGVRLQIGMVAHKPEIFSQLADSIPEAKREAIVKKFRGGLNDLDDAELTGTLSLDNGYFGRSFDGYDAMLNAFASDITGTLDAAVAAAVNAETNALNNLARDPAQAANAACRVPSLDDRPLSCYTEATRTPYLQAVKAASSARQALTDQSKVAFHATGFDRIADLVDNQPQLSIAVFTRNRRDLVGPSQFGGQLKLEWGFANLNRLTSYCGGVASAGCLSTFMNNSAVASSLERGDRVSLSVDFKSQPAFSVVKKDTVTVSLTPSWSLTPSLAYGFYVGKKADGADKGRFDLQVQHVWQLKESQRADQTTAKLTLTQPVSDQSSLLFGLSWANKPEYLGAAEVKIRANVGLTYHLTTAAGK